MSLRLYQGRSLGWWLGSPWHILDYGKHFIAAGMIKGQALALHELPHISQYSDDVGAVRASPVKCSESKHISSDYQLVNVSSRSRTD